MAADAVNTPDTAASTPIVRIQGLRGPSADDRARTLLQRVGLAFARRVADRIVFMHAGRIHEQGPPEQLFKTPSTPELQQFLAAFH